MSQDPPIQIVVFDVDGVMTDGRVTYTSDGQELKSFCIKDGVGIKRLHDSGVRTAIITGRISPMVERRAQELGISHVIQGREDKLSALNELLEAVDVSVDCVAYMGDDLPDLTAIKAAKIGACPSDASSAVMDQADWIASVAGGQGCVREFCDFLLNSALVASAPVASAPVASAPVDSPPVDSAAP